MISKTRKTSPNDSGMQGTVTKVYSRLWKQLHRFISLGIMISKTRETSPNDSGMQGTVTKGLRRKELGLLVKLLKKAVEAGEKVDITEKVAHLAVDMVCKMLFGTCICDRFDLCDAVHEMGLQCYSISHS